MHFDQDGTYNLVYIAEDECGNKTLAERVVEVATYRTVLYPDGTLIINEKSTDQASNEALHGGTATNVDAPLDSNHNYVFGNMYAPPWYNKGVTRVEVGSRIRPQDMSHWFNNDRTIQIMDLSNIDTSECIAFAETFANCQALKKIVGIETWDTSSATTFASMFSRCFVLEELDVSNFSTENAEDFQYMFNAVSMNALAIDTLDVSSFDTSKATNVQNMFAAFLGTTIYASPSFSVPQDANSSNMFLGCSNLVGGAGTPWNSSNIDGAYARIDGGSSAPGYFTAKA